MLLIYSGMSLVQACLAHSIINEETAALIDSKGPSMRTHDGLLLVAKHGLLMPEAVSIGKKTLMVVIV